MSVSKISLFLGKGRERMSSRRMRRVRKRRALRTGVLSVRAERTEDVAQSTHQPRKHTLGVHGKCQIHLRFHLPKRRHNGDLQRLCRRRAGNGREQVQI